MPKLDPFLMCLLGTVLLATVVPCYGVAVPFFNGLAVAVIGVMFFLQGARLDRRAILAGAAHWRLHLTIMVVTFVAFPLLGLGLRALGRPLMAPELWQGVLFLCCLPSTVQSSIAFTSIARGNVPAAVCSATASNIVGIFITPVLVGLILARHGGGGQNPAEIVYELLLPFIAGQVMQPFIGAWARRNKALLSLTDRGSILIVVYTAFSHAVIEGLWHTVPLASLGMLAIVDMAVLAIVLTLTALGSRWLGFNRADEITIVFCGSKKTLASGVPMANVLFPSASVGMIVLPLILYHQIQLFVCAVLARRFARSAPDHP
ncbi:bile acid/Na+ symporter [Ameyamaea chiangmaiensis NBRC 103196]|uniref:Bile acid:sodium symporter n=1 Tax=Ameyamaea chiangmaiensis TaxID=442969 RepID=A0A850PAK0_9PROT|nr:bile acid:sodium symporter family protein [Ameyamaea chiangmaiensis]MBS4073761.1 bile acid:sodium symporter [Ameyamaea chiangmaiensis]NVN39973.1 bile acid:sodium symporter [Ameyamaea chiangmaiensis]GBQ68552.1 bile acid/Na+ symporter [Ameyamaea chiangmaiensis NBRC 103196]